MTVKIQLSENRNDDERALEEVTNKTGFYTITEAVKFIQDKSGAKDMRQKLIDAVKSGIIKAYDPDTFEKYRLGVTRDFHEVLRSRDLNSWLKDNEPELNCKFPELNDSIALATELLRRDYKIRKNSLDPIIDKAIKIAGNFETADVFQALKELAMSGENPPFSSLVEGDSLCYTNDNDKPAKLSKAALGKRLKRRKDANSPR